MGKTVGIYRFLHGYNEFYDPDRKIFSYTKQLLWEGSSGEISWLFKAFTEGHDFHETDDIEGLIDFISRWEWSPDAAREINILKKRLNEIDTTQPNDYEIYIN